MDIPRDAGAWRVRRLAVPQEGRLLWWQARTEDAEMRVWRAITGNARVVHAPGVADAIVAGPPPADLADVIAYWQAYAGVGGLPGNALMHCPDGVWMLAYYGRAGADGGIAEHGAYLTCGHDFPTIPAVRGHRVGLAVSFHAHVGRWLFDIPGAELARQRWPIADAWRPDGARLLDRLMHARSQSERLMAVYAAVRAAARRPRRPDLRLAERIRLAIDAHCGALRIADLARDLGIGMRTVERCTREHFGLSPKRYARLRRLLAVTRLAATAGSVDWVQTALRFGFSDQAHLVREFTALHTLSPERFRRFARRALLLDAYLILPPAVPS